MRIMNMKKLKSKDKLIIVASAAGAMITAIMIPVFCSSECPEKKFIEGGREMLSAIPGIAKKYVCSVAKAILP